RRGATSIRLMPRIAAPTVAEHRARQRDALLAAARDLLIDGGYQRLSFTALAARSGLARPTIYSYFRSRDDLVVALVEAEFPQVAAETQRAVSRATAPRDQVAAFVRAQLRVARQRRYRIVHALAHA